MKSASLTVFRASPHCEHLPRQLGKVDVSALHGTKGPVLPPDAKDKFLDYMNRDRNNKPVPFAVGGPSKSSEMGEAGHRGRASVRPWC